MDALAERLRQHHAPRCAVTRGRFWFWIDEDREDPTIADIRRAVSDEFGVRVRDINSERRSPDIVTARHVAMHLARQLTGYSFPRIGAAFRRDHSTVILGCNRIQRRLQDDRTLAKRVAGLEARFA